MVRAKFRCLSITYRLDHTSVELKPVIPKGDGWPGGSEENRQFWQASPTGEASVTYRHTSPPFKVGEYYYIDLQEVPEDAPGRPWKLWEVSSMESRLTVRLGLDWLSDGEMTAGSLSLGIENKGAWPPFIGKVGTRWSVEITPAKPPESGLSTYP